VYKYTRNAIERATQRARRLTEYDFSSQLEGTFDVHRDGKLAAKAGGHLSARQAFERERIAAAIEHKRAAGLNANDSVADYLRDTAFTTLNRFVALKMLEARELVQECITKGEQSTGYREFCGLAPGLALLPDSAGYRIYIESLFDELSTEVKVLFDRRDPSSVLWPKRATFEQLLEFLNAGELARVWSEDETIGWVYQYFNSKEERQAMRDPRQGGSQAPRNSRELAVRNQFFTPRYVVRFLVDNTVGRLWLEMYGEATSLTRHCEFLVRSDEPTRSRPRKDPRDLRLLDPACGSGHFLLYCFDLLLAIYEEAWQDEGWPASQVTGKTLREDYHDLHALRRAVPALIVEHNLHGVDIDPRCAQIAALALWLRAQRAWQDAKVPAAERPRIRRTHIVVAEPMPGDAALVDEFAARLDPPLLGDLFKKMVAECRLAGELGSLLRVERAIAAEVARAREQFVRRRQAPGFPRGRGADRGRAPVVRRGRGRRAGSAAPPVRRRRDPGHRARRPAADTLRRGADEPALRRGQPGGEEGAGGELAAHPERPLRRLRGARCATAAPARAAGCHHLTHRLLPLELPDVARGGAAERGAAGGVRRPRLRRAGQRDGRGGSVLPGEGARGGLMRPRRARWCG